MFLNTLKWSEENKIRTFTSLLEDNGVIVYSIFDYSDDKDKKLMNQVVDDYDDPIPDPNPDPIPDPIPDPKEKSNCNQAQIRKYRL